MEDLLARAGGIVTRQALSKYELGQDHPSSVVAQKLSAVLGVKAIHLFSEPTVSIAFTGYRNATTMTATECEQAESRANAEIEDRVRLAALIGQSRLPFAPHANSVTDGESAESAAIALRKHWKLGTDPLVAPVACLEACGVHVLTYNGPRTFTGLSGWARNVSGKECAAVVVCRTDECGERQGLTAIHEVGHIFCKVPADMPKKTVEQLMFRFSAAVHAPAEAVKHAFGEKRTSISIDELLAQKRVLRLSLGALLYRLVDLAILPKATSGRLFGLMKKKGWNLKEPSESPPEHPMWLKTTTLRLWNEGVISHSEATRILGTQPGEEPLSLRESREFLKLPLEVRQRRLAEASRASKAWYDRAVEDGHFEPVDVD